MTGKTKKKKETSTDISGLIASLEEANKKMKVLETTKWRAPAEIKEIPIKSIREEKDNVKLQMAIGYVKSRQHWYDQGAADLGLTTYPALKFDGATSEEVIADLKLRFQINNQEETSKQLREFLDEAKSFISAAEKKEMFFKKANAFLGKNSSVLGLSTGEENTDVTVIS